VVNAVRGGASTVIDPSLTNSSGTSGG